MKIFQKKANRFSKGLGCLVILFIVYQCTTYQSAVVPTADGTKTATQQADRPNSVKKMVEITEELEAVEKEEKQPFDFIEMQKKLDQIHNGILHIGADDVQYPNAMRLTDRYFAAHDFIKAINDKKVADQAAKLAAKQAIIDAKKQGVSIGMTKTEVLGSMWGRPQSKNITTGVYGVHEQWVYRSNQYLYFDNGILTAIQTH